MLGHDFWKETLLPTFPNTSVFVSLSFAGRVPPNICAYKLKLPSRHFDGFKREPSAFS